MCSCTSKSTNQRPAFLQPKKKKRSRGSDAAVVAQMASARLSKREVPGSILGDFNVCFDFPLIRVAIALNTLKTEQWQRDGGKGCTVFRLPTLNKVTLPLLYL